MISLFLPSRLRRRWKGREPLVRITDLLLLMFVTSWAFVFVLKYLEDITLTEAVWQVWQTATTVGYGNRPAETVAGRYVTMFVGLFEIAMLGVFITAAVDYRRDRRFRRRTGLMRNPHADGYVIFNFPGESRFAALVRELRFVEDDVPICVVDDRLTELPSTIASLPKIHFVHGSTLSEETYHRARVADAKAVIVFPTEATIPESDGTTKTVVDLVARFVSGGTRIIHVLVDAKNGWMFDETRSTAILQSLEILALVQECQDIHSAKTIQQLLLNTVGANPQTVVPQRVVGWTWGELQRWLVPACELLGDNINPLAIVRESVPDLCPPQQTRIEATDFILLASIGRLDWDSVEACLIDARDGGV